MSFIELYDHEILAAEKVLEKLNEKQGKNVDLEDFRREAIDRFNAAGLVVDVKAYTTKLPGVFTFDMEILGRHSREEFDYEKMAYEVTNDILDLLPNSEKGQTIKTDGPDGLPPHKH